MWDEILWLRQCVTVSQSSCSCILQTRFKMLLAISQMQVKVGGWERAQHSVPAALQGAFWGCWELAPLEQHVGKSPVQPDCSWASRSR